MVTRERLLAIALTLIMVTAAGCAGWGTDSPADDQDQGDGGGETQADEGNGSDGTGNASDNASNDNSDASDTGSSSGDTGADSGDSSDGSSGDGDSYDAPADDGSSSSGDDSKSGSDSETSDDTSDSDSNSDSDSDSGSDTGDSGSSDGDSSDGDGTSDGDTDGNDTGDDDAPYGTLTVTVEDNNNDPVEGVEVIGIGQDGETNSATTDANGRATLDLADGDYTFYVTTDGTEYAESSEKEITMDGSNQSITLTVQADDSGNGNQDSETHTLGVTVYDHEGNPLPDASVSVVTDPGTEGGADVGSDMTNENGVAEFEVEDGAYEVSASHDEYETAAVVGPVNVQGRDETVDVTMTEPNSKETHTLTVNLANDDVDGVEIEVERDGGPEEDPKTTSKASAGGQASFDLESGVYYVRAEGYNQTAVGVELTEDRTITLQDPDGTTVEFTVTDAGTGEPIEGAKISGVCNMYYSSGDEYITGTTGPDGVAQAEAGVTPTECTGTLIEVDGYEDAHTDVSVPDPDGVNVELTPEQQEPEQHQLTVQALNHEGNALSDASVSVETHDGQGVASGTTNDDGVATFDLKNGDYEVSVTHDAYEGAASPEPFSIQGGDHTVEAEMTNPAGGSGGGGADPPGTGDVLCSEDFDSYDAAQAYFEQAPLDDERSERDKDNDGVACESLGPSPDAKAIVIVEDQNGERVANQPVTIDGEEVRTNEFGVASRGYDFHNGTGSKEITVVVQDEETTMTVATEKGATLDKESNIVEVTTMTAVAQDSQTSLAAAVA